MGCSQGHLQSTYQGHATNHDPNVKIQTHQTQPVHAGTAFSIDWKVFLPQLSKSIPKIIVKIVVKGPLILTKHLARHWLQHKGHLSWNTPVWRGTALQQTHKAIQKMQENEDCVNSNQFYTANMP